MSAGASTTWRGTTGAKSSIPAATTAKIPANSTALPPAICWRWARSPRTPGSAGRSGPISFTGRPDRVGRSGRRRRGGPARSSAGRDGAARLGRPVSVFAGAARNRDRRRVACVRLRAGLGLRRRRRRRRRRGLRRGGAAGFGAAARARRAASASRCALFCAARFCFEGLRSAIGGSNANGRRPGGNPATHPLVHRDAGGHARRSASGSSRTGGSTPRGTRPRGPRATDPAPPGRTAGRRPRAPRPRSSGTAPGTMSTPTIGSAASRGPPDELVDRGVVAQVLVLLGDHRAPPVPAALADDVHLGGEERVRGAHDRADVAVVLPVLDGDVERMPAPVEVGDDRLHPPVAVAVDDVAPVAGGQELGIEPVVVGPGLRVRPDAGLGRLRRGQPVARSTAAMITGLVRSCSSPKLSSRMTRSPVRTTISSSPSTPGSGDRPDGLVTQVGDGLEGGRDGVVVVRGLAQLVQRLELLDEQRGVVLEVELGDRLRHHGLLAGGDEPGRGLPCGHHREGLPVAELLLEGVVLVGVELDRDLEVVLGEEQRLELRVVPFAGAALGGGGRFRLGGASSTRRARWWCWWRRWSSTRPRPGRRR